MKLTREKTTQSETKECQQSGGGGAIEAIEKQEILPVCDQDDVDQSSLLGNTSSFSSRRTTGRYDPMLTQLPFRSKVKAVSILKALENVENFTYHPDTGEIVISGVTLSGSNMADLLFHCSRVAPPFANVKNIDVATIPGLQEFLGVLAKTIISTEIFQNEPIKNFVIQCRQKNACTNNVAPVVVVSSNISPPICWTEIE